MTRVVVIGGANVDIKGRCAEVYIPGTSNLGAVTTAAGGVARNIAENLARLGLDVLLITVLGDDANGGMIRRSCLELGIDLSLSSSSKQPTGSYLAILNEHGEMVSAVNDMRAMAELSIKDLERGAAALRMADMIVADCNIETPCLAWLAKIAERNAKRLLIEPVSVAKSAKLLDVARIAPVFAVTPNLLQLDALTSGADYPAALSKLHALGCRNIVLHRGPRGAIAYDGEALHEIPPFMAANIADVTGAGDAAVAGLVLGLVEGMALADAARLGQAAAAMKLSSGDSVSSALTHDRLMQFADRKREAVWPSN